MMDIALSGDDVVISPGGDLVAVESTREHQRQLLLNNKGDLKENPTICVGAVNYLDDDDGMGKLMSEISAQFSLDGMTLQHISLDPAGHLTSNAEYL